MDDAVFCVKEVLESLAQCRELTHLQMRSLMQSMLAGGCSDGETADVLIALRRKGETAREIAAAAAVVRERMLRWDTGRDFVLDTCGTGGDGAGTFNISTATALVVAGAGVPVVKHGNRGISSRSGSADVLAVLGVPVDGDMVWARRCLDRAGLSFCFAPQFHPALRQVGVVRRRLGVPTIFNWLGPLANPAGAAHQLLGVGQADLLDTLADALAQLGTRRSLLVCSEDGLDEVSLSAPTQVREVRGNNATAWRWTASDFGLEPCSLADLRADGPGESAARIRDILAGTPTPSARVVLANAAAALIAAERVATPAAGVAMAADAISSGRALRVLQELTACARPTKSSAV
jgi:anthranilate phosphoribosyltransferase